MARSKCTTCNRETTEGRDRCSRCHRGDKRREHKLRLAKKELERSGHCLVCAGLPWRVTGGVCAVCGLEYAKEEIKWDYASRSRGTEED